MKTLTLPELFGRLSKAARPGRPETQLEANLRKAEQLAANQEWEDEGGAVKPPPAVTPAPKIPL